MGKSWDDFEPKEYQEFCEEWGREVLRVLKPGAYLLAFSGTRTYHRMVVGLEDAGFEIKDQIDWLYGTGFPKGQNISKAIDKHKDADREVVGKKDSKIHLDNLGDAGYDEEWEVTKPATDEAKRWRGYNTQLKPAHEPIVLAQKPREGTYVENILKHGVGAINIDDCRIPVVSEEDREGMKVGYDLKDGEQYHTYGEHKFPEDYEYNEDLPEGRYPANLILDPKSAKMIDAQSGVSISSGGENNEKYGETAFFGETEGKFYHYGDKGGASRFFYCAKAHRNERNAGLKDLEKKIIGTVKSKSKFCKECGKRKDYGCDCNAGFEYKEQPNYSTDVENDIVSLKPINLMRYLTRLVTPEDGIVLDPFAGSGTTAIACVIEGFNYLLIEKRERFANLIAPKRIEYWEDPEHWDMLKNHNELRDIDDLKKEEYGQKDIRDVL